MLVQLAGLGFPWGPRCEEEFYLYFLPRISADCGLFVKALGRHQVTPTEDRLGQLAVGGGGAGGRRGQPGARSQVSVSPGPLQSRRPGPQRLYL